MGGGDAKSFQGNPKYLLLFLRNNPDYQVYWSTKSGKVKKDLEAIKIPYLDPYSWSGFFKILSAKYHFIEKSSYDTSYSKRISGRMNYVQTWHAIPTKKVGVHASEHLKGSLNFKYEDKFINRFLKSIRFYSRQRYKYILSTSDYTSDIFRSAFENNNIIQTGYPRNDIFFNTDLIVNSSFEELGLKVYDRVFLYAPTFRDNIDSVSPFSDKIFQLDEYLIETNSVLLVKKHPWEKNLEVSADLKNIIDISDKPRDIQEILIFTDLLITDYSSTFFDYMVTRKPVIFYTYDYESYLLNCRGMYYDYMNELQGPFAKTEDELINYVKSVEEWSKNESYIKKYDDTLLKFNTFQDGNSSKRVIDHLFDS